MKKEDIEKIFQSIKINDVENVKKILRQTPELINVQNEVGITPLQLAAGLGLMEIVSFMVQPELRKTIDISLCNDRGDNAIETAIIFEHEGILELLKPIYEKHSYDDECSLSNNMPSNIDLDYD